MDTLQTGDEPVKYVNVTDKQVLAEAYREVNAAWGRPIHELPPLTGPEAISAVKRLRRVAGAPVSKRIKFQLTSGRRYTWTRGGVYHVNPTRGWWHLVHDVAHLAHHRVFPGVPSHDPSEAYLERKLIEYVVAHGWLEGALKRPEKVKPPRNVKAERAERVRARLAAWRSKRKRADTAIKKLERALKYYERAAP